LFEGNALLRRLVRIGVLDESKMKLDYVLSLRIDDFLERRPDPGVQAGSGQEHPPRQGTDQTETHQSS